MPVAGVVSSILGHRHACAIRLVVCSLPARFRTSLRPSSILIASSTLNLSSTQRRAPSSHMTYILCFACLWTSYIPCFTAPPFGFSERFFDFSLRLPLLGTWPVLSEAITFHWHFISYVVPSEQNVVGMPIL